MRILCAPDSFKGTCHATDVAAAMQRGIRSLNRDDIDIDCCAMADGGEGTALILAAAAKATRVSVDGVANPNGDAITAHYAIDATARRAFVDLASASGWHFINPESPSILDRTTRGTGQLLAHAMQQDVDEIILGIGGSATCDGGIGILQELGVILRGADGAELTAPIQPRHLDSIATIDSIHLPVLLRIAADVRNPLTGPDGAAEIYGPQKGASPDEVRILEQGLHHLASLSSQDADAESSGAAGGVAFGLASWTNASVEPGIDLIADMVHLDERLDAADIVLTGEGRFDAQSRSGKVVDGILDRARERSITAGVICGSIDETLIAGESISSVDLSASFGAAFAQQQVEEAIERATASLVSRILAGSA